MDLPADTSAHIQVIDAHVRNWYMHQDLEGRLAVVEPWVSGSRSGIN